MELREYLRLLRRYWLLFPVFALAGAAAAAGLSILQPPEYEATAKVFVSVQQATTAQDLSQGSAFTQQVVKSYADVVTTPIVLDPVISELGLKVSAGQLAESVRASAPLDTVVLDITARSENNREAANLANAVSRSLGQVVAELTPSTREGGASSVKITSIQAAQPASEVSSPRVGLNIALGTLGGLVLALIIALLTRALDVKIRSERDARDIAQRPVIGVVAFDASTPQTPLIVHASPTSARAESFRAIRTNLQFIDVANQRRQLVITSSVQSEGKSTTAANLALVIAMTGKRVLLVDADLRRPRVADLFSLDGSVGLTDLLLGSAQLDQTAQQWGQTSLFVLPAGVIPPNPSELLQSQSMSALVDHFQLEYDYVIFDAPPVLPVTDAVILARHAGGAVMICSVTRTNKNQFKSAVNLLDQVGVDLQGVIVTMVPQRESDAYGTYQYGYDYTSAQHD